MARKSPNGAAKTSTYLLSFDLSDEGERRAWEVAQEFASERKLKHVLVGLLLAMSSVQDATGKRLDMTRFVADFIAGMMTGQPMANKPHIHAGMSPEELPSMFAGTADRVDPEEVRGNFSAGLGDLFDDDEDDLWE